MKLECNFFSGLARIMNEESVMDIIKEIANMPNQEDPFYVLNVGDIVQKIKLWQLKMPRVKPFYAVKCNDNQMVLELLAALGTGFDCASKNEIQKVLSLGVDQSRIIYAHPCKPVSHLRHAAEVQVPLMTFDNETELYKVQTYYPDAELVLRIRCDADNAQCPLGFKFGVIPEGAGALLETAKSLNLNVVGVSFHVGSGCRSFDAYHQAISAAKQVFIEANALGFNPKLLDIGGGFLGSHESNLEDAASYVNRALDEFFPEDSGVKVIAEPGRYVVASAFTLATSIVAKRDVYDDETLVSAMYYTNDGVYGSFNCILYDHQVVVPELLKDVSDDEMKLTCSIWGPTCDSLDQIVSEAKLPMLECGDWLVWQDMGAYTLAAAGSFNGFPIPKVHVVVPHHTWLYLEEYLGVNLTFSCFDGAAVHSRHLDNSSMPISTPACRHQSDHGNRSLEDQMAQVGIIDVGEM